MTDVRVGAVITEVVRRPASVDVRVGALIVEVVRKEHTDPPPASTALPVVVVCTGGG